MFKFKSITIKLFFLFLLVGMIPLFLIGYLSIRSTEQGIREEIFNGLVRYTESKEGQIFAYIDFVKTKGRYLASESFIVDKMQIVKNGQRINNLELNNFLKSKKKLDENLVGISILDLNEACSYAASTFLTIALCFLLFEQVLHHDLKGNIEFFWIYSLP